MRARVNIHVPVDSLLRIDPHGTASLNGYGDVPQEMVDYLLSQTGTQLRAVLCDPPTGRPVALGRTRRLFPTDIRELARVRDRECLIPGCHTPAVRCDTDHLDAWRERGETNPDNAATRCAFHNRTLKTIHGWHENHNPHTSAITLTTPSGQHHTYQPHSILTAPPKRLAEQPVVPAGQ